MNIYEDLVSQCVAEQDLRNVDEVILRMDVESYKEMRLHIPDEIFNAWLFDNEIQICGMKFTHMVDPEFDGWSLEFKEAS